MISTGWQPPKGFHQVDSRLQGVTVYAPVPAAETLPQEQTFKCPKCGADTAYSPDAGSVTCSHCGYVEAMQAVILGESAPQAEFTLDALKSPPRGWGQERREIHCESCGADMSVDPTDISTFCPFCGSNQVINRTATQETLRPNFLIPFKVNPETCVQKAREWLGKGWMHPSDLAGVGSSVRFQGIYLPFWTFSARLNSDWEAQVGYERTESYYDSGAKAWRTRTVIDWKWESGNVVVPIEDLLGPGSKNISAVLFEKIHPFDLSSLTIYEPGFLAGWRAKSYDIPLQEAWNAARERMRETAKEACYRDIPTSHVRSFSMSADFDDESWRLILLPVYLSAYRFQEKIYQVMVNGQTGLVAGQKPVAWWKVWSAIAALLMPGAIAGLIGLPLLAIGGLGTILIVIGAILFIIGLVISGLILRQAMQAGEA